MGDSQILREDELHAVQAFWTEEVRAQAAHSSAGADVDTAISGPESGRDSRVQELERQLEEVKESAYANGLAEGEQQTRAERQKYEDCNTNLAAAIGDLAGFKAKLRGEASEDLVQLSLGIARRILHREIHSDPDALRGIVGAALERINRTELIKVHTHPTHASDLERAILDLSPVPPVEVLADPNLVHGSLIFETVRGNIDGSIDSQLDEIRHGLADGMRRL